MKCFFLILIFCPVAWPQIQAGSVAVYSFSQNEITMAADSRVVFNGGRHADTKCKIRAFGNKFFVVITGFAAHDTDANGPEWSGYKDARDAWMKAGHLKGGLSAERLTNTVAQQWTEAMESHLNNPAAIAAARSSLWGGPYVVSALFGATNKEGELAATVVDIALNIPLFDAKRVVKLSDNIRDLHVGDEGALGLSEIATEFHFQTSERAKRFMLDYLDKISRLTPQAQDAAKADKLVELSIKLHPRREFLGFPVDELQLVKGKGINWLKRKETCKEQ